MTIFLLMSCSQNLLSELDSKTTDDALLFDAQTAVNAQRYQDAITIVTAQVSSAGQQRVEAREILANAYAGKCGLNFIDYTDSLANATNGSAFVLAATPFVGRVVDPASCLTSLQTLDLIGPTASRNVNQNALASVVGMVLMGSATRLYTDNAPTNGDGAQDSANISCGLSNTQIDQVILGYAYMAQNFSALTAAQIGSSSQNTITASIAICNSIAGSSCTNTDPAQISTLMRDTMKDLMNTSQYGVGTFDASNPVNIPAACP